MDRGLANAVRARANFCCEYCRIPQDSYPVAHHIEHIIAQKHGGESKLENLALACFRCNLYKGPNIAGIDPETGVLEPLFNPRKDEWQAHFRTNVAVIEALSGVGRTTAAVLRLNHADAVLLRASLLVERPELW